MFRDFLSQAEAHDLFECLNDDAQFPWDKQPVLFGERLTQHAYEFTRSERKIAKWPGLASLEALCERIESYLDGEVTDVFCNRFQDTSHSLPWHTDTYGHHIVVLSLGHGRRVQFRDLKTQKDVVDVLPKAGDVYFMPLRLNDTHEHQVCAAESPDDGTRLSFVFFFKTPKYAKEFKITTGDKIKGFFEAVLEKVL